MKIKILAAAAVATMLATPAFAQDGSGYIQVNLGASLAGDVDLEGSDGITAVEAEADLETGLFGSIAAGANVGGGFSAEGEIIYLNSDIDTGEADTAFGAPLNASLSTYAVMANVIYTFNAGSFTPYVGAGVGFGKSEYEIFDESDDDAGIAWQLRAGVSFPMSDKVTWDVGYRYLSTPGYEVSEAGDSLEIDAKAHVVTIGARYAF